MSNTSIESVGTNRTTIADNSDPSAVRDEFLAQSDETSARRLGLRFRPSKVFVALPAYNEEESLPELRERLGESFADSNQPYEIVIVNDGSKDATASITEQFALQMPLHFVNHAVKQGLGTTIRDGSW